MATSNVLTDASRDFFSNISSDLNGIAASTTNMFSDLFGSKKAPKAVANVQQASQQQRLSDSGKTGMFGPFPTWPEGLSREKSIN